MLKNRSTWLPTLTNTQAEDDAANDELGQVEGSCSQHGSYHEADPAHKHGPGTPVAPA